MTEVKADESGKTPSEVDKADEGSWESFPASDPPATGGVTGPNDTGAGKTGSGSEKKPG